MSEQTVDSETSLLGAKKRKQELAKLNRQNALKKARARKVEICKKRKEAELKKPDQYVKNEPAIKEIENKTVDTPLIPEQKQIEEEQKYIVEEIPPEDEAPDPINNLLKQVREEEPPKKTTKKIELTEADLASLQRKKKCYKIKIPSSALSNISEMTEDEIDALAELLHSKF